jgi:hypothetical protein
MVEGKPSTGFWLIFALPFQQGISTFRCAERSLTLLGSCYIGGAFSMR